MDKAKKQAWRNIVADFCVLLCYSVLIFVIIVSGGENPYGLNPVVDLIIWIILAIIMWFMVGSSQIEKKDKAPFIGNVEYWLMLSASGPIGLAIKTIQRIKRGYYHESIIEPD